MLRDKNLIPLSHGHQHTLALCVRIDRALQAGNVDLKMWQAELSAQFERAIAPHFSIEEREIFPLAARFADLQALVTELLADHVLLRSFFSRASTFDLSASDLEIFVETIALHIRKEERELFEGMQRVMSEAELASLGAAMSQLSDAAMTCPLRPAKSEPPGTR